MYDELIIEEIKRKQRIENEKRPQLELPLDDYWNPNKKNHHNDDYKSKIITIDLDISEE
jgi:hypothetical protein